MKELSIEEKAKAYDEAIERAKDFMNGEAHYELEIGENIMCWVFPELAESEDERLRKRLQSRLDYWAENGSDADREEISEEKAWLEKQGEMDIESYKAAEDEKREFIGDGFIKCYANFQDFKEGETYWLEYVGNDNYNVRSDNLLGKTYHITPCHLYTIFKKQTWLEKQGEQKPTDKVKSNLLTVERAKEMSPFMRSSFENESAAWSEEDGENSKNILYILNQLKGNAIYSEDKIAEKCIDWLKSFKERYTWRPSDEQMKALEHAINCYSGISPTNTEEVYTLEIMKEQLKKLKE